MPRQDLIRPPAALPILAAACEEVGIEYEVHDFNLWLYKNVDSHNWEKINDNWIKINSNQDRNEPYFQIFLSKLTDFVNILINNKIDLVALSVFTDWSAHATLEFAQVVDQRIKIAIGGTGIEADIESLVGEQIKLCEYLLKNNLIDYYLYGEGESVFRQLLKGNTIFPGINNYDTEQLDNLNQFPHPSYKKIDPWQYNYIGRPELSINGSRGCVRKCTYCDVARFWPKFRFRSGEHIANEIYQTWKQTNIHSFEFTDSLINGNLREFRNFNKSIIQLQQQDPNFRITYKGQFICRVPSQYTENDYKEMKQAGCDYLYVGVETFSDRVRFDMDKKFDNNALDFHLEMCGRYNIPNAFLMITGYPTETLEDHELNIAGLHKYRRYAQAGIINLITFGTTTGILENTPLERMQPELAIVKEFENLNKPMNWISLKNPSLGFRERVRRWIELVELATDLNYNQPRIDVAADVLGEILEISSRKNQQQ
jgi:hypothetical protein